MLIILVKHYNKLYQEDCEKWLLKGLPIEFNITFYQVKLIF